MALATLASVLQAATITSATPVVAPIVFDTNQGAAPTQWSCVASADHPHWSKKQRGGTVLFKTRVTCIGPSPADVRIIGTLASAPAKGGPYKNVARSDKTQRVNVDGTETVFHTPPQGDPKVTESAWYRGQITVQVVVPVPSGTWTATSDEVHVETGR